jgi:hypothetical protein
MERQAKHGPGPDPLALARVLAKSAGEACALAKLPPPALALLAAEQTPRQFLDALLMRELYPEAIRYLAFALPAREAVWWACLCVQLAQPELPAAQQQALHAAARWVAEPTEAHRHAAEPLAATSSAAGYAAKAVAWTGGSLLPPSLKPLKPGPTLPHEAACASVSLAVASASPDRVSEARRHALALGVHVARGKHLWPAAAQDHQAKRPRFS